MNSSLRGPPAFDPQEQDPTFVSKCPTPTADETQIYSGLPPPPVEIGKVTTFNCDICGQDIHVERQREWQ